MNRANPNDLLGIECEHHYGITTHHIPMHGDAGREVYRLIREVWHAPKGSRYDVLDHNHNWEDCRSEVGWSRVHIIKNDESPAFATLPCFPSWAYDDGAGSTWFSQRYRIATRKTVRDEYNELIARATEWDERAKRENATKSGQKRAKKARSVAWEMRRQARVVAKRWASFDPSLVAEQEAGE